MKKFQTIFACAVLAALASCSNDSESPAVDDNVIRMYSSLSNVTTKTAVPADENTATTRLQDEQFGINENVNVYIYENYKTGGSATYSYGSSKDGSVIHTADGNGALAPENVQYFPANGNGIDVIGLYPSTVKKSESSADFTIQQNQTDLENYRKSDLMFGKPDAQDIKKGNPVVLKFEHQLSKIIVKLDKDNGISTSLDNATIKLTNVHTKVKLDKVDMTGITLGTTSEPNTVTVGKYDVNGTAAIVIPQNTDSNMQFEVTLATGGTYKASVPSTLTAFAAKTVHTFTLKLKANQMTVSSSISSWTQDGTSHTGDATLQ